jgi:glycogen synthase
MAEIIAFITYEGPWFKCGGIGAVMDRLPSAVAAAAQVPVVVVTPFHRSEHGGNKIPSLPLVRCGSTAVPYRGVQIPVTVYRHTEGGVGWFFLAVGEDRGDGAPSGEPPFFAGERHPYDLPAQWLLRDSLIFGQAVVRSLAPIATETAAGRAVSWRLVMQDWEAATTALAFASQDAKRDEQQGKLYLTLHNSYDAWAPPADEPTPGGGLRAGLLRFGINPGATPGATILERALSQVETPVFTVSEPFAAELGEDLLQREVMTPHLQPILRHKPVLGVDNGLFKDLAVPRERLEVALRGETGPLRQWKRQQKTKALEELGKPLPESVEAWGDPRLFQRDEEAPWVVMAGRDDPRQKGYDVAAAAAEAYLEREGETPGCAQFLFFPIPGDEGAAGLGFLDKLARRFPRRVLVFLGRWEAGFGAALRGSVYGLMPSLYEPFGMAHEIYLDGGCVGIARATGGSLIQIVPLRAAAASSRAMEARARRYHALSAPPTGILYREPDDLPTAAVDWKGINDARYDAAGGSPDRVEERRQYRVFRAMAEELRVAVGDGVRIYREEPELYDRMLLGGIAHVRRTFSWARAAQEYVRHTGG